MTWAVGIVLLLTLAVIIHLFILTFPREEHLESDEPRNTDIDIK